MAQYGMIYDANSIKRQLYESNRGYNQRKTWEGMFLANDIQGQKSNAAATNMYSAAMNDAYTMSTAGKDAITGSNLGQGFKQSLISENELAIQQAFDTYSQNLANTRQGIDYNVNENAMAIDKAATEQANYTKDYADAHFKYLEHLYAGYESGENTLFDSKQWSKYLTEDETGTKRLLDRNELTAPSFVEGEDGTKEWTSLYDDKGNLTTKGLDFFDQIQNQNLTANTFGSYLAGDKYDGETVKDAERRQELLNWSQSYNPYNYTFDGSNKGTFKTMVGMSSTDNMYSFAERFGGFTKQEVDNLYEGFNNAVTNLSTASKNAKDTTKAVNDVIGEIEKLAIDLGIEGDFPFEQIKVQADAYIKGTKDLGDISADYFSTVGAMTAGGAATGASIGAGIGSIGGPFAGVTAVGGGLVGGAIGLITGVIKAVGDASKQNKQNTLSAKQSKEMYTELLNNMINYSKSKRRQAEIEFSKQNNRF